MRTMAGIIKGTANKIGTGFSALQGAGIAALVQLALTQLPGGTLGVLVNTAAPVVSGAASNEIANTTTIRGPLRGYWNKAVALGANIATYAIIEYAKRKYHAQ